MRNLLLLILLVACRTQSPRKVNNNALHFVDVKKDETSLTKLADLNSQLTEIEKQILTQGYVRFYRYAMRGPCNFSETFEPGPGLPRLGIPPLVFLDLNRRQEYSPSQLRASFLDISTAFEGEKYYYFGEESDKANQVFFNLKPLPAPKMNEHGFELLMLRSGVTSQSKFMICAIHYSEKNLCVEDFLTKEFVDVNNQKEFCQWLDKHKEFPEDQVNSVSFKLLQILNAIEVVKIKK